MLNQNYSLGIKLVVFFRTHVASLVIVKAHNGWDRDYRLINMMLTNFVTKVLQAIFLSKSKKITIT